jgi:hypothetical protein
VATILALLSDVLLLTKASAPRAVSVSKAILFELFTRYRRDPCRLTEGCRFYQ